MGKFVKGDVVVVPFPFSDLTANKKRPALVVAALTADSNIILYRAGVLAPEKIKEVVAKIVEIVSA